MTSPVKWRCIIHLYSSSMNQNNHTENSGGRDLRHKQYLKSLLLNGNLIQHHHHVTQLQIAFSEFQLKSLHSQVLFVYSVANAGNKQLSKRTNIWQSSVFLIFGWKGPCSCVYILTPNIWPQIFCKNQQNQQEQTLLPTHTLTKTISNDSCKNTHSP